MKEIPLTKGKVAIVDDRDYEWLSQWKWSFNAPGYAVRGEKINGRMRWIKMHRQILGAPEGKGVDHIDRDGLNNRRSNLRLASHHENSFNRSIQVNNTSGYIGVSWYENVKKWSAKITFKGIMTHLGLFTAAEDAACAYNYAAMHFFGEYAHLNNVPMNEDIGKAVLPILVAWPDKPRGSIRSESGFIGVVPAVSQGKWWVYVSVEGHRCYIGTFASKEEAAYVYDQAALQLVDHPRLNLL